MARQNFKLTLTLTNHGASGNNPDDMETRIGEAIGAAGRHHLTGRQGAALNRHDHREPPDTGVKHDGTIVWHLHGELSDAKDLVARWRGNADNADPITFPAFKPNVTVSDPEDDP